MFGLLSLYVITLTQFPETIRHHTADLSRLGVKLYLLPHEFHKPSSAYTARNSVRVKFPLGWVLKERDDGSCLEVLDFIDSEGDVRITIRAKLAPYECYTQIHFYTNPEIIAAREEQILADQYKGIVDTYINDNFARKWSHENNTIIYFFKDGQKRAKEYYGMQRDRYYEDAVYEFSEHVLIGFCWRGDRETKIAGLTDVITQYHYKHIGVITSKTLVTNRVFSPPISLHRYEALHMFGCDTIKEHDGRRYVQVCTY